MKKNSPIHGVGVFATQTVLRCEFINVYTVQIVSNAEDEN